MIRVMTDECLRLNLGVDAVVPSQCCWRVDEGYLRMVSLTEAGETLVLGVWGPGDLVIPTALGIQYQELVALSAIRVERCNPSAEEKQQVMLDHLRQISALMLLSRIRPVEDRLLRFLIWLGERFGRVSSTGVSLSPTEMNLTHRNLAELVGSTRVTATKSLTRFKQVGLIIHRTKDDILIPHPR